MKKRILVVDDEVSITVAKPLSAREVIAIIEQTLRNPESRPQ